MRVWHYTVGSCLRSIWKDGVIKPATAFVPKYERPVVWFSLSESWEPSANKGVIKNGRNRGLTTAETERLAGGLFRIGVSVDTAPLDWQTIRRTSGMASLHADALEKIALNNGEDLDKWRGTYEPVAKKLWLAVEGFQNGAWAPVDCNILFGTKDGLIGSAAAIITPNDRLEFNRQVEEYDVNLWAACYPRIYASLPKCGDYCSSKELARVMAAMAIGRMSSVPSWYDLETCLLAQQLKRFDVPMFWICKDMAEALHQTIALTVIDWGKQKLPFEACAFMLPKGSLTHPVDGDVTFIAYARIRAGEMVSAPSAGLPHTQPGSSFIVVAGTATHSIMRWTVCGTEIDIHKIGGVENLQRAYYVIPNIKSSIVFLKDERDIFDQVYLFLVNTLLVMVARPELAVTGNLTGVMKSKAGVARQFWSPNVIGADFKIRKEATRLDGTHHSPRWHWVRGHLRDQACGEKHSRRKVIWIEPFMRGGATNQSNVPPDKARKMGA